jgi:hypothetical protein
VFKR